MTMTTLNDRERSILLQMQRDRLASIKRKRSWQASVKAISMAEVTMLTEKLMKMGEDEDDES